MYGNLPPELRLSQAELESVRNSYPLYMFDNDARCSKCGGELWQHGPSSFGEIHREGFCGKCGLTTMYDTPCHVQDTWVKIKHTWVKGKRLDRAQIPF